MKQDFFTYLPTEITLSILSRLPLRTIARCKCVRKSWHSIIETPEFAKFYKSIPCLAVFQGKKRSNQYKVYDLEDELNLEYIKNSGFYTFNFPHYGLNHSSFCNVFNFSFPHPELIHSTANGLLLLYNHMTWPHKLIIWNPITRDYITLPGPQVPLPKWQRQLETFGFGVSKTTGQYKVVRIFREGFKAKENESQCQVNTLGTGLWRCISPSGQLMYGPHTVGAFVKGNFHWLASDLKGYIWISCFDLETELFSTFSAPNVDDFPDRDIARTLSTLGDCLGLCDNSSRHEIVIWLMITYGDEKSWTKQFVIAKMMPHLCYYGSMCAIKVLKNGDILLKQECNPDVLCYSDETRTIRVTHLSGFRQHDLTSAVYYTPSFLRLKTFAME